MRAVPAAALLLTAACGTRTAPGIAGATTQTTGLPSTTPEATPSGQYVIGPGDRLTIFVYESPQLSTQDLPVRPDGRISTPLIQDIVAAGKTPSELSSELADRLKKFVREPNVTVMVREFFGPFDRQVRVIGEAAEPQSLPYRDNMTVLDVMILTKGLTKFASGNRAVIVRRVGNGRQTIPVRLADLLRDGDIEQNVAIQPGDTLIIPQTWF